MNIEPIIDVRINEFRQSNELENMPDGEVFERFVNHAILSTHQPDAFGADTSLMDFVCVGGHNDTGIDGIAIKLNGLLIKSEDDVRDILSKQSRAQIEFIFIQSKYTSKFDSSEYLKFAAGIRDFLSEEHKQPQNDAIKSALRIKDVLLGDDIVRQWDSNPEVRVYYIAMGKWRNSPHITGHAQQLSDDIGNMPAYGKCSIHFVDGDALKSICDSNANKFSVSFATIDTLSLPLVRDVDNSCIALCYASEFVKLVTTDEGVIRKSLFNDNVRDYQGSNLINDEIESTITKEPDMFGLLNNGITVVCDSYMLANRRITIKDPQIVNGCQTSHVLFSAAQNNTPLDTVPVQIKVIATRNSEITSQIVRGTNRQNIVLDEAFEATRQFHKDLEEVFIALGKQYVPIFYERRHRQYQHDPRIKQTDKVNLRALTQSVVGMFFNKPHLSHRHEAWLLKEFESKVYDDSHSKMPYYTAAVAILAIERLFRSEVFVKRDFYSYRHHIAMMVRELISGGNAILSNERDVDKKCRDILDVIKNASGFVSVVQQAMDILALARARWVNELGRSAYGTKDIAEFSELLISECRNGEVVTDAEDGTVCRGVVSKVFRDRKGNFAGFIRRPNGDVFFHSQQNSLLDFESIFGKAVTFRIENSSKDGREYAVDVSLPIPPSADGNRARPLR